jgi:hypothetical protein
MAEVLEMYYPHSKGVEGLEQEYLDFMRLDPGKYAYV